MPNYLNDFKRDMLISGFSLSTQKSYTYMIEKFFKYSKEYSKKFNCVNVKDYLYHIVNNNHASLTSLKQSIGAIKFFLSTLWIFLLN
jgi:hypothetical protein